MGGEKQKSSITTPPFVSPLPNTTWLLHSWPLHPIWVAQGMVGGVYGQYVAVSLLFFPSLISPLLRRGLCSNILVLWFHHLILQMQTKTAHHSYDVKLPKSEIDAKRCWLPPKLAPSSPVRFLDDVPHFVMFTPIHVRVIF